MAEESPPDTVFPPCDRPPSGRVPSVQPSTSTYLHLWAPVSPHPPTGKVCFFLDSPAHRGAYNKKRNLGSQPYSLVFVPTKFLVGGFIGGHWFITSP